jgi:hypothetical protein
LFVSSFWFFEAGGGCLQYLLALQYVQEKLHASTMFKIKVRELLGVSVIVGRSFMSMFVFNLMSISVAVLWLILQFLAISVGEMLSELLWFIKSSTS